jgi:hypothetical protein
VVYVEYVVDADQTREISGPCRPLDSCALSEQRSGVLLTPLATLRAERLLRSFAPQRTFDAVADDDYVTASCWSVSVLLEAGL